MEGGAPDTVSAPRRPRLVSSVLPVGGLVAVRILTSVVAGALLYWGFPPRELWVLGPLSVGLLVMALRGVSPWAGAGLGSIAGAAFFAPLLPWVGEYVGPGPWLALASIQATFLGVFGAAVPALWTLAAAPLWIACTWVAVEAARSRVPFGGFGWGRAAFGQADGPMLPLAAWAGAPGLSFAVAVVGAATAALFTEFTVGRRRRSTVVVYMVGAVVVGAAIGTAPQPLAADSTRATVALVQGNVPRAGLDFNAQRRAVLGNHVRRTLDLAADVEAGRTAKPDLVVWPENSSDIDPLRDTDAAASITLAARAVGAPILVGAVLRNDDGSTTNAAIVWDPVTGPGDRHDKRKLVPFGEYLPMRGLIGALVPAAERAGRFVPGSGDGTVEIAGIIAAVATCYEVAFDDMVTDSVRAGAQLITVPTNNATFGRTDMTYQQLAMSRVRAVEHARSVIVSATSGASAIITPRGVVEQQTGLFTDAALVADVPIGSESTPATRLGSMPEGLAVIAALAALVLATCARRKCILDPTTTEHGRNQHAVER